MTRAMAAFVRVVPVLVGMAVVSTMGLAAPRPPRPPLLVVAPSECSTPPLSLPDFDEALEVELAANSIRCCVPDVPAGPALADLVLSLSFNVCEPTAGHVAVSLRDSLDGRITRREIDMDDVAPEARPRALALVVAELVRSTARPAPPRELPGPPPEPVDTLQAAVPPRDKEPEVALHLGGDGIVRLHPARDTTLWGGRLWLAGVLGSWQLEAGVDAATSSQRYAPGTVTVRSLAACLTAGPRWTWGQLVATAGVGADAGVTWIAGQSPDPGVQAGSGAGLTGAVRARLGLEGPAAASLRVRALLEAGLTLAPIDAYVDTARVAGTSGLFVGAALGLAYATVRD